MVPSITSNIAHRLAAHAELSTVLRYRRVVRLLAARGRVIVVDISGRVALIDLGFLRFAKRLRTLHDLGLGGKNGG